MKLANLFFSFAKIGLFTFGGGYSMLPMLQKECVEKHKWASDDELLNYYAIGQCTPGIIAVNTATFIGNKQAGIIGGIVATLGIVFPSLVIILILASALSYVMNYPLVIKAFSGIRIAVCALILSSIIKLIKKADKDLLWYLTAILTFFIQVLLSVPTTYIIIFSIVVGLVIYLINRKNEKL